MTTQVSMPEVPTTEVPLERLEHEIATLAAHINAATCRWLQLIAEFDRREGWVTWGTKNCAEWLAYRCGLSHRAARDQVRVARALEPLPLITEAFANGTLSYSKVRTLVRVARPETEAELLGIALHASAAQLAQLLGAYRRVGAGDELAHANRQYKNRFVGWSYDEDENLTLTVTLPPEQGQVLLKALDMAAEQVRSEHRASRESGTAVPHEDADISYTQAMADGLTVMAETFMAVDRSERPAAERHQVMLHVDLETLKDDADGRCQLGDQRIAPETARRLSCDSSIVTVVEKEGEILDIGRKSRRPTTSIRRALRARDRGCRFPGCPRTSYVDAHHIEHWVGTGETKLSNLVELCRFHHRFVHEGGYGIQFIDEGIAFTAPDGTQIGTAVPLVGSESELRNGNVSRGIGPETVAVWSGDPLDLDNGVHGLLSMDADIERRRTELRHRLN